MPTNFRSARAHEAEALRNLERDASLAALAHIFPPSSHPYPAVPVLERWRDVLATPSVHVLVCDDDRGLTCVVAYDAEWVRHLAVRPAHWGAGLSTAAMQHVATESSAHRLWCLEANDRAIRFYRGLGWRPSGRVKPAEWPPHPSEVEMVTTERDGGVPSPL